MENKEYIYTENQSLKTEASNVDFIKIGLNPAVLVLFIMLLLYLLGKAHGNKKEY